MEIPLLAKKPLRNVSKTPPCSISVARYNKTSSEMLSVISSAFTLSSCLSSFRRSIKCILAVHRDRCSRLSLSLKAIGLVSASETSVDSDTEVYSSATHVNT